MLSEIVKQALVILDFDNVPSMAELRNKFLKLCIERHPDKGGENDQFQKLMEAKLVLSKYISEFIPEDKNDSVEVEARKLFKEFNEVQMNKNSITIKYLSKYGQYYDSIFQERYTVEQNRPRQAVLCSSELLYVCLSES